MVPITPADAIARLVAALEAGPTPSGSTNSEFALACRAGVPALLARVDQLTDFIQEFANEPCEYGDNCPLFVKLNHYRCLPCKARDVLAASGTGGEP